MKISGHVKMFFSNTPESSFILYVFQTYFYMSKHWSFGYLLLVFPSTADRFDEDTYCCVVLAVTSVCYLGKAITWG